MSDWEYLPKWGEVVGKQLPLVEVQAGTQSPGEEWVTGEYPS